MSDAITDEIEHGEPTARHRRLVESSPAAEAKQERAHDIQDCVSHSAYVLGLIDITTSHPCQDPELAERVAARVHEWTNDGTWQRIKDEDERRRREERGSRTPSHKTEGPPRTGPMSAERPVASDREGTDTERRLNGP